MSKFIQHHSDYTTIDNWPTNQMVRMLDSNYDSFGRIRVSNPYSLIEASFVLDANDIQYSKKVTGSGTINRVQTHMVTSVVGVGSTVIQTRQRAIYEPGKSLQVLMTGVLNNNTNDADTVSRIGYYDDDDGIFFEYSNSTFYCVKRSSSSGSVVETKITITNGMIDLTKTLIFVFDMEWLGVGSMRASVIIDNTFHLLHTFKHSNVETLPYMNLASLHGRYELISVGGNASQLCNCICVMSEGGHKPRGRLFSCDNHVTTKSVTTTAIPIIAFRIKSGSKINAIIQQLNVIATSNNPTIHYHLYIIHDGAYTLTGVSWVDVNSDSQCEYDVSSTLLTTSVEFTISGYLGRESGGLDIISSGYDNLVMTSNRDGVADVCVLTCESLSGTETVVSSILFKQYI